MIVGRIYQGPTRGQLLSHMRRLQRDLAAVLSRPEVGPAGIEHLRHLERRLRATIAQADSGGMRNVLEGGTRAARRQLRRQPEQEAQPQRPAAPDQDVGDAPTGAHCTACGWPLRVRDTGACPTCSGGGHLA